MEIFEARLLGENLYLHQGFTQCSKWRTSCILFRSCCNIHHPSIKYVIYIKAAFYKYIKLNILQVRGDMSHIYALGRRFFYFSLFCEFVIYNTLHIWWGKIEWKTKKYHCRNSFNIHLKNRRKRQIRYHWHTYTWSFTFLAWYMHFGKVHVSSAKGYRAS